MRKQPTSTNPASIRRMIDRFEARETPPSEFGHAEHVHLAWAYLESESPPEAISRLTRSIEAFAAHHGAGGKYHATITWAFVLLVNERRAALGEHSWEEFVAANPDLMTYHPNILERYYRPETLKSELARKAFLMPDRIETEPEVVS